MFYQTARRLMRLRFVLIIGTMLLLSLLSIFNLNLGEVLGTDACETAPRYRAEVPQAVRDQLDSLQAAGLLLCNPLEEGLAQVEPLLYWGSDGMRSIVFFQAVEGETLEGIGLSEYNFGDGQTNFYPSVAGDRRHPWFRQAREGRRAWTNQAEGDAPTYFLRVEGAPGVSAATAYVEVFGELQRYEGPTRRDFRADLERLWATLRGQSVGGSVSVRRGSNFLFDAEMLQAGVQRDINPALLNEDQRLDPLAFAETQLPAPMLYQTLQGRLGSTVWVAGVVSDTNPVLALLPREQAEAIAPEFEMLWSSDRGGSAIKHFAFPRMDSGQLYEAQYWSDPKAAGKAPPDYSWPLSFNEPAAAESGDGDTAP